MIDHILKFLKQHRKTPNPVLLAFSGGPDSLSLLHLLIEYQQIHPLPFSLAHVDHGWREESSIEAETIVSMAQKLQVPLHLKKLNPKQMSGNLEAACREERLQFFASLCREHGYEAVLMGHHADDMAETVLKRLLEGAALPYLAALCPEMLIHGMKVWRPLLAVPKKNILKWLEARNLQGFHDRTNLDTKFLRAKFRVHILPFLTHTFGKDVSPGLCHLAKESKELRDYLDEQIAPYLKQVVKNDKGSLLDLRDECPRSLFELKYLIKQFCKENGFSLSRESLEKAATCVQNKATRKSFNVRSSKMAVVLLVDKRQVQILAVDDESVMW